LAALSASSLPQIPTWLGTQRNTTSFRRVCKVEFSSKILRQVNVLCLNFLWPVGRTKNPRI
jgi:hypothetical protein